MEHAWGDQVEPHLDDVEADVAVREGGGEQERHGQAPDLGLLAHGHGRESPAVAGPPTGLDLDHDDDALVVVERDDVELATQVTLGDAPVAADDLEASGGQVIGRDLFADPPSRSSPPVATTC